MKIVYLARLHTMYGSKFTKGSDTVYVARLFFKTLIFLALGIVCCSCELLDQNLSVDALGRLFDVKPAQVDRSRRGPTTSEETAILNALQESAVAAEQQYRYETAAAHYQRLLQLDPGSVPAVLGLTRNLRYAGSSKNAVLFLKDALLRQDKDTALLFELVKAQIASGLLKDAQEGLISLEALEEEEDWELHALQGVLYDHLGHFERAQQSYRSALELSPKNISVLNNLSMSLAQAGKLDQAISLLGDLSNSEYSNPQVRQNLALLYGLKGDFEAAGSLAKEDLSPEQVTQNLQAFRMLHE